jgi:hypothetical protein
MTHLWRFSSPILFLFIFIFNFVQVRHLEKEMAKYKKQARAEKQELSFEQSVPSQPAYQYQVYILQWKMYLSSDIFLYSYISTVF